MVIDFLNLCLCLIFSCIVRIAFVQATYDMWFLTVHKHNCLALQLEKIHTDKFYLCGIDLV